MHIRTYAAKVVKVCMDAMRRISTRLRRYLRCRRRGLPPLKILCLASLSFGVLHWCTRGTRNIQPQFEWYRASHFDVSERTPYQFPICSKSGSTCSSLTICKDWENGDAVAFQTFSKIAVAKKCLNRQLLEGSTRLLAPRTAKFASELLVVIPVKDKASLFDAEFSKPCVKETNAVLLLISRTALDVVTSPIYRDLLRCFREVAHLSIHKQMSIFNVHHIDYIRAYFSSKYFEREFKYTAWFDSLVNIQPLWLDTTFALLPTEEYVFLKMPFPLLRVSNELERFHLKEGHFAEPGVAIFSSWNHGLRHLVKEITLSKIPRAELESPFHSILGWAIFNDACTFKTLSFGLQFYETTMGYALSVPETYPPVPHPEGSSAFHLQHSVTPVERRTRSSARRKILVAIVFCRKQLADVFAAVKRWNAQHVRPCEHYTDDFGLLFVQSDPDTRNSTKEELFDFLYKNGEAVRCFSTIRFSFTSTGFDGYHAGPAQMFKETMLGDGSAGFDYVYQMEPDIYPIRPLWLTRLASYASGDFWVKGSVGLYFDHSEADAAFVDKVGDGNDAILIGPVGYRLLHINGNALYSLSPDFKSCLRMFFETMESKAHGLPCTSRKNRMVCSDGVCHGSFDTTLAEYLISVVPSGKLFSTRYLFSPLVFNGLSEIPISILPDETLFAHKPWYSSHSAIFDAKEFEGLRKELRSKNII